MCPETTNEMKDMRYLGCILISGLYVMLYVKFYDQLKGAVRE